MTSYWPPPPGMDPSGQPAAGREAWEPMSPLWYDAFGPTRTKPDYGVRRDLPVAAVVVFALLVAGAVAGFAWHALSARPQVIDGPGGAFGLPANVDKNYFGAEAAFLAVTALGGLASGIAAWNVGKRRGPAIAAALALGSVGAGLVARAVGEAFVTNETLARVCGTDTTYDQICSVYDGHLELRVLGLVLTWAIVALAAFITMTALTRRAQRREAGRWEPPEAPVEWQSAEPHVDHWPPPNPQQWPPGESG